MAASSLPSIQLESINLAHLPASTTLHVALFKDVQNTAELYGQLLAGNAAYQYAFIDASLLISRTHVLAACFRALNDLHHRRLRTRNVHSEIVFSLSSTNNINSAFKTFGISPAPGAPAITPAPTTITPGKKGSGTVASYTQHVLAIKVSTQEAPLSAEVVRAHLASIMVASASVPFNDDTMKSLTDWERVKKAYKMDVPARRTNTSFPKVKGIKDVPEIITIGDDERDEAQFMAVGMMALRGS